MRRARIIVDAAADEELKRGGEKDTFVDNSLKILKSGGAVHGNRCQAVDGALGKKALIELEAATAISRIGDVAQKKSSPLRTLAKRKPWVQPSACYQYVFLLTVH